MSQHLNFPVDVFEQMKSPEWFQQLILRQFGEVAHTARLFPRIQAVRLFDAHQHWAQDLDRVSNFELRGGTPDHFKQAGHLIYWLRRLSPVTEWVDPKGNIADAEGHPLTQTELEMRELLLKYGNEYLAFDFGYRLCRFYEENRVDNPLNKDERILTPDYIKTMAHFLKTKNVSPHAMFLILKSLFLR